jgi:hypothetical protein
MDRGVSPDSSLDGDSARDHAANAAAFAAGVEDAEENKFQKAIAAWRSM